MSDEKKLKRCINAILDSIHYDFSAFEISSFIRHLETLRGKSFHFVPLNLVSYGAFGMWITSNHKELFFYEETSVPAHRIHIIMHEIGHMLCGHKTVYRSPHCVEKILSGLHSDPVGLLRQYPHDSDKKNEMDRMEQQAEMLANLLQERIIRHDKLEKLISLDTADEDSRRFLKSIGLY